MGLLDSLGKRELDPARRDEIARAAHIIQTAHDGIITTNEDGEIEVFNPAAERLFGMPADEVSGRSVLDLLPGLSMTLADGSSREIDGIRTDGTRFAAEVTLNEVHGASRPGLSVFVRDVTERRRADEALARERNFVSAVLDTAAAIVLICDPDGRVVRFNRACELITGYGSEDLQGKYAWDVLAVPEERAALRASLSQVKDGICPPNGESLLSTKSGSKRRISWSNAILPDKYAQPAYLIATGIDITEKVELETQLSQAQKMEAVGRLAGGVAHDFNNLVTVITGFSELVIESLSEDDPCRTDLIEIRKAGERAGALTRQLLAFSRKQIRQPQMLDLNAVVRDVEAMLRRLMREDIELRTDLQPGLDRIKADRGQMEQILINLAVNARDAMQGSGVLTIRTANSTHSGHSADLRTKLAPGAYVVLTVSDTGSGITDEALPQLFEPFFTTKPQGIGTGLGLSTVYGIVSQSEGGIGIETALGVGTSFHIYLPRVEQPRVEKGAAPAAQRMPRGAETVLLVEDDSDVRAVIRRILSRAGYQVICASAGQEGIEQAQAFDGPIHLLVTDIVMPKMSGPELLRRLLAVRPEISVLFVSGHTQEQSVRELDVPGDAAFLQKPFPPDLLARRVREVLDAVVSVR
jgi:PAS domain S-box-containing protein